MLRRVAALNVRKLPAAYLGCLPIGQKALSFQFPEKPLSIADLQIKGGGSILNFARVAAAPSIGLANLNQT